MKETHRIDLTRDPALIEEVACRGTEVESGARKVDNILTNTLRPDISRQLLGRIAEGLEPESIHVGIGEDGSLCILVGGPVALRRGRNSRPLRQRRQLVGTNSD